MDMSDDLRSDFFDIIPLEPKFCDPSSQIMPVTLIGSPDYMQTDGNNNLNVQSGHVKSFLDEMLLGDPLGNGDGSQSIVSLNSNTFEVLGTFQWTGDGITTGPNSSNPSCDDDSPSGDPNQWFLSSSFNSDGEVTTLTSMTDPLFVEYENAHVGSMATKIDQHLGENRVVSSDLISSSVFLNEQIGDSPTDVSQSSSESDLILWQKSSDVGGNGISMFSDDSLLRSALQSGNNSNSVNSKVVKVTAVPTNEMTELRKVLSFPPLTSPTSSTSDNLNLNPVSSPDGQRQPEPYINYELKVIDPLFSDDSNIPNVEDLIMTRIGSPFAPGQLSKDQKKKLAAISEKKINSTTMHTKWTYATPNDQGKTQKRKNKKNNANTNNNVNAKKTSPGMNENRGIVILNGGRYSPTNNSSSNGGSPSSPLSSGPNSNGNPNHGNGIRKERSLHYCSMCTKGFKDKYSVNVHIRTHTGEKPFGCGQCGKNFRQKAHLAKHFQTHNAKANNPQNKPNSKR